MAATNWEQYDLDKILSIFMSVNVGSLNEHAGRWRAIGAAISNGGKTLADETRSLAGSWKSRAASAFTDSAGQAVDRMTQWGSEAPVRGDHIELVGMAVSWAQGELERLKAQRQQELDQLQADKERIPFHDMSGALEGQIVNKYNELARTVATQAAAEISALTPWKSPGPYVGLRDVQRTVPTPNLGPNGTPDPPGTGPPNGAPNGTTGQNEQQPVNPPPGPLHQLIRTDEPIADPRQDGNPQTGPQENNVSQSPNQQQVSAPQTDVPQVGEPPAPGQSPGSDVTPPPTLPGDVPGGVPGGVPIVPFVPGGVGGGSGGRGSSGLGSSGLGSDGGGGGLGGVGAGRGGAGVPTASNDLLGRLAGTEGGGGGLLGAARPPVGTPAGGGAPMIPPMIPPVGPGGGNGGALSGRQTRRTARSGGAPRVVGQEPVAAPQSISGRPVDKKKAPPPRQQETERQSAVTYGA
ncbi:hypothetical protein ABGB07_27475 [Micromonosporaceae bacterium B7E4]